ncbi:MAG TPA: protein kinase [Candidatus Gracilibacteria bacterium]
MGESSAESGATPEEPGRYQDTPTVDSVGKGKPKEPLPDDDILAHLESDIDPLSPDSDAETGPDTSLVDVFPSQGAGDLVSEFDLVGSGESDDSSHLTFGPQAVDFPSEPRAPNRTQRARTPEDLITFADYYHHLRAFLSEKELTVFIDCCGQAGIDIDKEPENCVTPIEFSRFEPVLELWARRIVSGYEHLNKHQRAYVVNRLATRLGKRLSGESRITHQLSLHKKDDKGDLKDPETTLLLSSLGAGGMGTVIQLNHPKYGPCVAKVDKPGIGQNVLQGEVDFMEGLRQVCEERGHPYFMPRFLEQGETEDRRPYLLMRYGPRSTSVNKLMRTHPDGCLDPGLALHIATQTAQHLAFANAQDYIHRDIKPANLVLDDKGNVIVIDPGVGRVVARDIVRALAATDESLGSDPSVDVSSAGVDEDAESPERDTSPEPISISSVGLSSDPSTFISEFRGQLHSQNLVAGTTEHMSVAHLQRMPVDDAYALVCTTWAMMVGNGLVHYAQFSKTGDNDRDGRTYAVQLLVKGPEGLLDQDLMLQDLGVRLGISAEAAAETDVWKFFKKHLFYEGQQPYDKGVVMPHAIDTLVKDLKPLRRQYPFRNKKALKRSRAFAEDDHLLCKRDWGQGLSLGEWAAVAGVVVVVATLVTVILARTGKENLTAQQKKALEAAVAKAEADTKLTKAQERVLEEEAEAKRIEQKEKALEKQWPANAEIYPERVAVKSETGSVEMVEIPHRVVINFGKEGQSVEFKVTGSGGFYTNKPEEANAIRIVNFLFSPETCDPKTFFPFLDHLGYYIPEKDRTLGFLAKNYRPYLVVDGKGHMILVLKDAHPIVPAHGGDKSGAAQYSLDFSRGNPIYQHGALDHVDFAERVAKAFPMTDFQIVTDGTLEIGPTSDRMIDAFGKNPAFGKKIKDAVARLLVTVESDDQQALDMARSSIEKPKKVKPGSLDDLLRQIREPQGTSSKGDPFKFKIPKFKLPPKPQSDKSPSQVPQTNGQNPQARVQTRPRGQG